MVHKLICQRYLDREMASGHSFCIGTDMSHRTCSALLRASAAAALIALSPHEAALSQEDRERLIVPLAAGQITLPSEVPETLPQQVGELVERRLARTSAAPATAPLIVIFEGPLDQQARQRLTAAGVTILNRLDPRTYTVSTSPEGAGRLAELPSVVSATLFPPDSKIAPEARRVDAFEWEQRAGGRRAYSVLFFEGTPAEEVLALQDELNAELEEFDPRSFPVVRTAIVVIDPEDLPQLAAEPSVQSIEPAPPPDVPDNANNTQPLSNVDDVQLPPYNLSGTGMNVGVWEATEQVTAGFGIRDTHEDLTPRVTVEEVSNFSNHATHVAGTIAASGANSVAAEGMAPAANLASYGSNNDANEMTLAVTSAGGAGDPLPIVISNHSYGTRVGWWFDGTMWNFSSQNSFGNYTNTSQGFDNVVSATDLVVVKSAGNDRNDVGPVATNPRDCTQNGLGVDADCIGPRGVAKNIITVGAMNGAGAIAGFSSFGPTDDGRIKPDLMAQGVGVTSTGAASDMDTFVNQGTSMSTPAVAGMAALLLEEADAHGLTLSAAAVKAILMQTAQDVTVGQATIGPDFATGYGIADIQAAVDLLQLPGGPGLAQDTIASPGAAGAFTRNFAVQAGEPELKMTLAWTDPAGNPLAPQNQPKLQNDLDLRLIAPDGTLVQPWRLDPAAPATAAVRDGGDDTVNNVEQVSVLNPAAGIWQAQVTAKATSASFPQAFAIAGPLTRVAPLSIAKTDSPDAVAAGAELAYTVSVTNDGPDEAIDVEVVDNLPAGVTLLSATSAAAVCMDAAGTVTCEIAAIAASQTVVIDISVTVDDLLVDDVGSTSISNTAAVSSPLPDPDLSDNSVSEDTLVLPGCGGVLATLIGTPADDHLLDTAADDVIATLAGDDTVIALRGGNDAICGGQGDDNVVDRAGDNEIYAGPGDDNIDVGSGNDAVDGGLGDDTIVAGSGDDTIDAGFGDDNINAGSGSDAIDSGPGDDNIGAGPGDDSVDAGAGNDSIVAASGDDAVDAGAGDDNIATGAGDDTIDAGPGDDSIDAGPGDDLIDGGPGTDTCVNGEIVVQCE